MRTRSGLAALVLAASATLAGCGGGTAETAADASPTSSGPTATSGTPSPSESVTTSPADPAGEQVDPQDLLARMKAAVEDNPSAAFQMVVGANQQTVDARGDLRYRGQGGAALRMTMQLPQGAGKIRMISTGGEIYAAIPGATPPGKFLLLDKNVPGLAPLVEQLRSADPLSSFASFDAGLEQVVLVGEETLDGEDVDRYRFTVDTAAATKAQGMPVQPGLPKTIEYDVWLDGADLMRRIEFAFAGTTGTITMSRWGQPVRITAPPATKVVRAPAG